MSITNEDRYDLQAKANHVVGRKEGTTLMELLPPVGWADVATKRDLDQLEARLIAQFERRFVGIDHRFVGIDQRFVGIDQRFERVDQQFERVDDRFDRVDQQFERVNDRFDRVDQTLTTALAEQTAAFQTELRKMYGVLLSAMVALATLVAAIVALSS
ncbi:MAG: hypothetical protein WAX12_12415 [Candidatus Microthrix subdominans]|jgi:septation ring formation regulator EzrA|uniref:t-SNARE coiled-coil homology domain-containing protein n=1 Tax=Candidatus Neomicrothrix subdominans TaxID=2954438 RepID=A0A936NBG1_9ACTN|nr:hypothetical protein [Candidatus Microthrix sp.]MBK9296589.1 hypothetical protein [Candidatus Microthrix subdominans]MBK6310828.1 hypothetical protein [Candidatus Microthrix sp.]MBK6440061.1 hypothetical protein [Candidatus Microthrix sp.]MBK6968798.1 hypothetical protein [Candidatus Microthrix sp.]MBK7166974.1 hypothetical protein [Candidatus Microthrix sp.]